jgi:hypothetical protein
VYLLLLLLLVLQALLQTWLLERDVVQAGTSPL